jgi:hypothetical protein
MKNGYGVYKWANKNTYKGEWVDNQRHGTGDYKWSDGTKSYTGEWVRNNMHGKGILKY